MNNEKKISVGIGFATGRKSFQKILKTYAYSWKESGLTNRENLKLSLIVAYDLKYSDTEKSDYTNIRKDVRELIDETYFMGKQSIQNEISEMIDANVLNEKEATMVFGNGYAAKRNAVLFKAIKNKIDYLLFLDDDEYPLAVLQNNEDLIWKGQQLLSMHLHNIKNADITNGYHCGYISPIPFLKFNDVLTENDFRLFIEAISNDIIKWDSVKSIMNNGGVTYADPDIIQNQDIKEVKSVNQCKFISGANLCINLTRPDRVNAFYNPPDARGEDTFLSTCLNERKVIRIPCYAFHDEFSKYTHILDGVLPNDLKNIKGISEKIVNRFYRACIGWIRYKPLLLYITQREQYDEKMLDIYNKLKFSLPKICAYFDKPEFMNVLKEFEKYNKNVKKHYEQYIETKQIWGKIVQHIDESALVTL